MAVAAAKLFEIVIASWIYRDSKAGYILRGIYGIKRLRFRV